MGDGVCEQAVRSFPLKWKKIDREVALYDQLQRMRIKAFTKYVGPVVSFHLLRNARYSGSSALRDTSMSLS